MYLNEFADDLAPLDMTASPEFESLLQSATDLGIPHSPKVRYVSRHTVVRSLRFHFTEWGEPGAPEILLLHGGNQSGHSWDLVSLHLSDRYHVFALDQRGHGDSEWARDQDSSIDARIHDALAFIEDQGLESPVIMGHSMGGRVTMGLALTKPELAKALVIVDVGPELSPAGVEVIANFVTRNVEFDDLDEFLDNVVKYDKFRTREHIARTVKYNMLRRADGKYISKVDHRRVPVSNSEVTLDDVKKITCPVLLVRGGESDILEPEAAQRFADTLPQGRLVTVPNTGHNVHSGNTPGFLEAIGPFLAAIHPT
ncbi:MAG: alpha/beta hydrolase [Acidimicrobiia bacterium]